VVVPNGVGQDVFDLAADRPARPAEAVTFVSILNGWGPLKNAKVLIKAFSMVRDRLPGMVELKIIGSGFEVGGPAEKWAAQRHADAGIEFIGSLTHPAVLKTLAYKADILVHPSLEESCCMAVNEAMAIGLPVIGGENSGGIPWVLAYGKAGMLADVTRPLSLAKAMELLAVNAARRLDLGASGRRRALEEYEITRAAAHYEDLLETARRGRVS
jgi:glycosyltransferase involved in cell wall biosynthesis